MARQFNSTSDAITTPYNDIPTNSTPFSAACWCKMPASPSSYAVFMGVLNTGASTYSWQASISGGGPHIAIYRFGSANVKDPSAGSFSTTAWNHFVMTFDGGTTWLLYINGAVETGAAITYVRGTSNFFALGSFVPGDTSWNGGAVADGALWEGIALTQAEVNALVAGVRPGRIRPSFLKVWLPCDGYVSPEPDYSGKVNNGTLIGTSLATSGPPIMPLTPRWPQFIMPVVAPTFSPAWARPRNVIEGVAT